MFESLIQENNLWPEFEKEGFTKIDMLFIKELIHPPEVEVDVYPFRGRGPSKAYMYQIVSNPFSGIDVDKMDYIARDAKALNVDVNFDFRRYLKFARILRMDECWTVENKEGHPMKKAKLLIGIRDKEAMNMYSMFRTRQDLHRKAYQHKTTKISETHLMKIFAEVDDEEIFPVYSEALDCNLSLSTAHRQTDAYQTLTNDLLNRIRIARPAEGLSAEKQQRLVNAQKMIKDLDTRNLPKLVHTIGFNPALYQEWLRLDEKKWKTDLLRHHDASSGVELSHSDVEFVVINFDYGQKVNDPIAKVPFYRKDGSIMRTSMREISLTLPGDSNIAEQKIFVYATTKEVVGPVRVAAQKWEEKKQMEWSTPKRLRTATGFPLDGGFVPSARPTTTMNSEVRSILSPASSMGGVEEEEEDVEDEETVDSYDRPDTP